jgi:uncharacterized OB-fold protein
MSRYIVETPEPSPETRPYWEAVRAGKLSIQRCEDCGEHIFYPRLICPSCMSEKLSWVKTSGRGQVYTFTVVQRTGPAHKSMVPYVVALVTLAEGPRMMSWLKTDDIAAIRIGMAVKLGFAHGEGDNVLPLFEPA